MLNKEFRESGMSVFMEEVQDMLVQRKSTLQKAPASPETRVNMLCFAPAGWRAPASFLPQAAMGTHTLSNLCQTQQLKLLLIVVFTAINYVYRFLVTFLLFCPFVRRHLGTLPSHVYGFRTLVV